MKRAALGLFSLSLLIAGALVWWQGPSDANWVQMTAGSCLRAGFILGALWLAFPQVLQIVARFPPWLMGCAALGLLIIIRWPKAALVVVPFIFVLWLLRGRPAQSRQS